MISSLDNQLFVLCVFCRLGGNVIDCGWPRKGRCPTLMQLFKTAEAVYEWLLKDPRNVCIIHCMDGLSTSALLVSTLLMYTNFLSKPEDALQIFAVKRQPPNLHPSEMR